MRDRRRTKRAADAVQQRDQEATAQAPS
jgi:hypothetical protein